MSEQLAIDAVVKAAAPAAKPLSERQQRAFDYVREHDGVTADELGAWLHAHKQKRPHSVDQRCEWCARDGNSVLGSAAVKPLVKYRLDARLGRVYVARNPADRPESTGSGVIATSEPDPAKNIFADL